MSKTTTAPKKGRPRLHYVSYKKNPIEQHKGLQITDALLFITQRKAPPDFDKLMTRQGAKVVHVQENNEYVPPHSALTRTGQNQTFYSVNLPGHY